MGVIELQFTRGYSDLNDLPHRLEHTNVRRGLAGMLNESARIGEQSIRLYIPKRTHRAERAVGRVLAHPTPSGAIEAATGVGEVSGLPRGASSRYPYDVHEGTGVYGHFRRKIRPKVRKYMRFVGSTGLVYAKTVRGQRPQPFVREAYDDVLAFVEARAEKLVDDILGRR